MDTQGSVDPLVKCFLCTDFCSPLVQQVAAKDTEIGTWSDWSVAVHATPWIEDPLPITSTTEVDFPTGRLQRQVQLGFTKGQSRRLQSASQVQNVSEVTICE